MTIVAVLINCLKDWDKLNCADQVNNFKKLIDSILLHLGIMTDTSIKSKVELLAELQDRIEYLIKKEGIDEDLLVMGLVNFVTESLEATLMKQGHTIILDEKLISSNRIDLEMKTRLSCSLEQLKQNDFYEEAIKELDQWNALVASNFSRGNRAKWKRESSEVITEDLEEDCFRIHRKILNILSEVSIINLMSKVDIEEIKNLTHTIALREGLIYSHPTLE